jgi:hypothetical protein
MRYEKFWKMSTEVNIEEWLQSGACELELTDTDITSTVTERNWEEEGRDDECDTFYISYNSNINIYIKCSTTIPASSMCSSLGAIWMEAMITILVKTCSSEQWPYGNSVQCVCENWLEKMISVHFFHVTNISGGSQRNSMQSCIRWRRTSTNHGDDAHHLLLQ